MLYVIDLHNHLSTPNHESKITPIQKAFGFVPDISKFLQFHWWQPVLYKSDTKAFPSGSYEGLGRFVGIATNIGDVLTYYVLTDDTMRVIARSCVRPMDPDNPNIRVIQPPPDGEEVDDDNPTPPTPVVKTFVETIDPLYDPEHTRLPSFSPEELLGRTFLHDTPDGQRVHATIMKRLNELDHDNQRNIRFLIEYGDPVFEEIMSYGDLSRLCEEQDAEEPSDEDKLYIFKKILSHHGPLKPSDPAYLGSSWNLKIEWEDGSRTFEPLDVIGSDDPASCAKYALENDLLETPGWKRFRRLARREKKMKRMIKQAALASKRSGPIFKFGVQIPRNEREARELDKKYIDAGTEAKWFKAEVTEIDKLNEYNSFKPYGPANKGFPRGYRTIRVFFVYDVKHDLRHRARLVAGGHMTPVESCSYSSVISLKTMRMAIFAGELNGLKAMAGDIGSAYLEAYTKEKVCFVASAAFGKLEGHVLIVSKALYGLRTSGARYRERFADTLRDMGFTSCVNEPDLWLRRHGPLWEYVCVYVDDLLVLLVDPVKFFTLLTDKYGYQLKGVEAIKYHLGGNYFRDPDGTLAWGAQKYIQRMLDNFERDHGKQPKKYASPMRAGESPELSTGELLSPEMVKKYQSLLGALQWCVTLGRFDIFIAVMSLSRFRIEPKNDHWDHLERVLGYLRQTKDAAIRFRVDVPEYPVSDEQTADWDYSVYDGIKEEIPTGCPAACGKPVRVTVYVDANLMFCKSTGRLCTGFLILLNNTPVHWFCKLQATVESATYGSEFMAARIAVQHIIDIRTTLRYMGIPLDGPAWLFGDNQSVISSSTIPSSVLKKRHNALSYHTVRAAIASGYVKFSHVKGEDNPADILTKYLEPYKVEKITKPLLFWQGVLPNWPPVAKKQKVDDGEK